MLLLPPLRPRNAAAIPPTTSTMTTTISSKPINEKAMCPSLKFFVAVLADFAANLGFIAAVEARKCRVVPLKVGDRLDSGASRERDQREHAECNENGNNKPPENHEGDQQSGVRRKCEASITSVSHMVRPLPMMSWKNSLHVGLAIRQRTLPCSGEALDARTSAELQVLQCVFDDSAAVFRVEQEKLNIALARSECSAE